MTNWLVRLWYSFSAVGLLLGTLCFAASLMPTLLPRTFLTQGVLSGFSFSVGYGIGVFCRWLWTYLELPQPSSRTLNAGKFGAAAVCAIVAAAFLWKAAQWQNSIRKLMDLEPVDTAHPLEVGLIALATFTVLIAVARLFGVTLTFVSAQLGRFVPRRVSQVVGFLAATALFWSVISGVLFRVALHAADASYKEYDSLIKPEMEHPRDPHKTGSSASLLDWEDLGRAGREFISSGPSRQDIAAFSGKDAHKPIRVYVGLRSAETPVARAKLAFEELKRVGGFDQAVLIVVTPTGSGWIDPAGIDSVEYLHNGDVASVAVQYSYLTSWLSLLVEPAQLESNANYLITALLGCSWDASRAIVDATGSSFSTRCDLILKLGRLYGPSEDWFLALEAEINHIKADISPLRNRLIHDVWLGEDKQLDVRTYLRHPQSREPKALTPPQVPERTVASIWALSREILLTSAYLQELRANVLIWKKTGLVEDIRSRWIATNTPTAQAAPPSASAANPPPPEPSEA